jgi:hypothetical protein
LPCSLGGSGAWRRPGGSVRPDAGGFPSGGRVPVAGLDRLAGDAEIAGQGTARLLADRGGAGRESLGREPRAQGINQLKANYYASIRPFTGGVTVRDWLTGRSFADQYEFGIHILMYLTNGSPLP